MLSQRCLQLRWADRLWISSPVSKSEHECLMWSYLENKTWSLHIKVAQPPLYMSTCTINVPFSLQTTFILSPSKTDVRISILLDNRPSLTFALLFLHLCVSIVSKQCTQSRVCRAAQSMLCSNSKRTRNGCFLHSHAFSKPRGIDHWIILPLQCVLRWATCLHLLREYLSVFTMRYN